MTYNAGSIEYNLDINTAQMLLAESQINKSLTKVSDRFKKADEAVRGFMSTQKQMGRTINDIGQVIDKNGEVIVEATKRYRRLSSDANQSLNSLEYKIKKTTGAVRSSFGGMGRNLGMAGVQVQQFVGQIQGGQSALLALSQQGADLGIVLGQAGLGAAIGITATALSFLIGNSTTAESALDKLADISKDLEDSLVEAGDGSDVLSRKLEKLADRSESLARLQISGSIQDVEKQLKVSADGIKDALDDVFSGITKDLDIDGAISRIGDSFSDVAKNLENIPSISKVIAPAKLASLNVEIGRLSNRFGVSRSTAVEFASALSQVQKDASPINIKNLENILSSMNDEAGGANENIIKLAKVLIPLFEATSSGVDRMALLRQAFADFSGTASKSSEKSKDLSDNIERISSSIENQIIALGKGEEAAFRYATAQSLGLKIGEKIPENIDKQITALFKLKAAEDAARKKERKKSQEADREKRIIENLDRQIAQREMTKQEYEEFLIMQQLGIENEGMLTDEVQKRLDKLRELNAEQGTFSDNFKAQLEEIALTAEEASAAVGNIFGQASVNAIDNFSSQMADVITQQQTLEDGVKSVGRALVSELLSGIIKVGAQMAIQSALGNSLQATNTAATVSSMGAITAAAAPAAAATNAATGGASAAAGLSVMSAAIPAMVGLFSGLALAGSRAHGGTVSGGSMYKMGEQGFEVYRTKAGDVYGVPGKNGDVISNKDLMGGNEISVQVNNYGNDEVKVSRGENGLTIDIVKSAMIDDVNRNGPFMKSLTSKSSIKNKVR